MHDNEWLIPMSIISYTLSSTLSKKEYSLFLLLIILYSMPYPISAIAANTDDDYVADIFDLDDDNDGVLDIDEFICSPIEVDLTAGTSNVSLTDFALSNDINYLEQQDLAGQASPLAPKVFMNGFDSAGGTGTFSFNYYDSKYIYISNTGKLKLSFYYYDNIAGFTGTYIYDARTLNVETSEGTLSGSFALSNADEFTLDGGGWVHYEANYDVTPNSILRIDGIVATMESNSSGTALSGFSPTATEVYALAFEPLVGCEESLDSDHDSFPNYLDLDSDNDGIPDNIEAQTTQGYKVPAILDSDSNGLYDVYEVTAGSGEGITVVDTDSDGIPDYLDLDSDNDGVFDSLESGLLSVADIDGDGRTIGVVGANGWDDMLDGADDYVDSNANLEDPETQLADADWDASGHEPLVKDLDYRDAHDDPDGDGIVSSVDIDDDNDGVLDTVERSGTCGIVSPDSVTTTATNIDLALSNTHDNDLSTYGGTRDEELNGDVAYYYDVLQGGVSEFRFYSNGGVRLYDGQVREIDTIEFLGDTGAVLHRVSNVSIATASVQNYTSLSFSPPLNGVRSIRLSGMRDTTNAATAAEVGSEALWREVKINGCELVDSDNDSVPDYLDLDSDNDGIPDNIEAQSTVGYKAPDTTDSDGNGLYDIYEITAGSGEGLTPVDTDEDGVIDILDLDSDDDGINDIDESGLSAHDSDGDGRTNGAVGANGLDNTVDTADDYSDVNGWVDDPADDFEDRDNDVSGAEPMKQDVDYRDDEITFGHTISGYVFTDSNVNQNLDSGEGGITGVTVVLSDAASSVCRSVQSGAKGYYFFEYVKNGDYTLYEATNEAITVPANCPPALADPTGYASSTPNQFNLIVDGIDVSNQNFGDVQSPRFELDNQKTAAPNTLVTHPHVFTTPTDGSVRFSIAEQFADPVQLQWGAGLMEDVNCDGQLDSGDVVLVNPLAVSAGEQRCLLVKVIAPSNASSNAFHTITLESDFTFAGSTGLVNIIQQRTDLTRVVAKSSTQLQGGIGQLDLHKSVWNVTRNTEGNVALPGEVLRYTVYYKNTGTGLLNELIIHDSVPEFTELVHGSMLCTDRPSELPLCAASENVSGSLNWSWGNVYKLQAGSQGSVSYDVMVE